MNQQSTLKGGKRVFDIPFTVTIATGKKFIKGRHFVDPGEDQIMLRRTRGVTDVTESVLAEMQKQELYNERVRQALGASVREGLLPPVVEEPILPAGRRSTIESVRPGLPDAPSAPPSAPRPLVPPSPTTGSPVTPQPMNPAPHLPRVTEPPPAPPAAPAPRRAPTAPPAASPFQDDLTIPGRRIGPAHVEPIEAVGGIPLPDGTPDGGELARPARERRGTDASETGKGEIVNTVEEIHRHPDFSG